MESVFDLGFAAFLAEAQRVSDTSFARFGSLMGKPPTLVAASREPTDRYVRIVSDDGVFRRVWCFVDTETGDVLKPLSATLPAPGRRGNIFDERHGCGRAAFNGVC